MPIYLKRNCFLCRQFLSLILLYACVITVASADILSKDEKVMLQAGPFVLHWSKPDKGDHRNNWPGLLGAEWENAERWELGTAVFKNSFYQPCIYVYGARRWFLPEASSGLYVKLSGGPLYGYRGKYEKKVPFNYNGLGLAVLPALGYQYGKVDAQAVILGTAAVIFTFGYQFN